MAGRRWQQWEIDYLEEKLGKMTVPAIAKKLKRSYDSVNIKINRLGLTGYRGSTDTLSLNQLAIMFGVDSRTIRNKWMKNGLTGTKKTTQWSFSQIMIIDFLRKHQDLWNAARVTDDTIIGRYAWYQEKLKTDKKTCYKWKATDVSRLKMLRKQGYYISEIAKMMNRSESSIKFQLYGKKINSKKD